VDPSVGHHCGVFGAYNVPQAALKTYFGLFALQHRGQESAGIVVSDGKTIRDRRGMGLVAEVFRNLNDLESLPGHLACGHVRYSTTGSSSAANIQPLLLRSANGLLAVAHNGNLTNARGLRRQLENHGSIFQTTTDSEIIAHLMAQPSHRGVENLAACLRQIKGAFNFLLLTQNSLIAVRDRLGFRPLVIGQTATPGQLGSIGVGYYVASETCALDQVGAQFIREVEPGEIVTFDAHGMHSEFYTEAQAPAHCMFEHVYFGRPDSVLFGDPVHAVRIRLGEQLYRECPVEADVVFAVPDSGMAAAIGFSRASGIRYDMGFIRSHYVGRSFIKPDQVDRETVVDMKFNVISPVVEGKRVVVVEDSLIRGTTFKKQAKRLRQAGAKEVHLRISCPPTRHGCYYGIDFPDQSKLIAHRLQTVDAVAEHLGVDSLGYLSVEGLLAAVSRPAEHYCTACWTGRYPEAAEDDMDKFGMEEKC
jgi:amidophosphoribosyltransferase